MNRQVAGNLAKITACPGAPLLNVEAISWALSLPVCC